MPSNKELVLIITSQLSKKNNYWLQSLRTDLKAGGEIRDLMDNYESHKTSQLYKAFMDTILRANWEEVEVEKKMCDALRELFADELEESREKGFQLGAQQGIQTGKQEASDNIRNLICQFLKENRLDDLRKATENKEYWDILINEYHGH